MEKNERTYTTLHNHTHYSNLRLIDSINTEETLIDRAYELGLKGVAITDHESVSGHIKALNYYNKKYTDEQKEDFKLILGNEIYLTRSTLNSETHQKGEKFYHLLLLAKDAVGHEQLRQLSSKAWNRAYYRNMMRTPTFMEDLHEVVKANSGHLICSTACLGSYPAQMFLMNELEAIDPFLQSMVDIFGKDNFFIEIQPSMNQNQIDYNSFMIVNFWQDYNFIFTTDSHYLKKEDQEVHRLYLQSKSGATREVDEYYGSAYLMDYEEVKTYFDFYISMPKIEIMKNNTNKINNMITSYSLNHGQIVPQIEYENRFDNDKLIKVRKLFEPYNCELKYKYLDYYLNTKDKADSYLINLILEGYSDKLIDIKDTLTVEKRMERLDYELEQIHETSLQIDQPLADYFITMSKMIDIIWNEADSLVGPGRGSASGFLINYLIGITQIDPMIQELYMPPWRFIHKDRPGLPDIDIDTESEKRLKIFNKISEYFNSIGSEVINVCTFGTEGTKSSIRTAGRSLDIDDNVISYLTSMVPNERGTDLNLTQCYYGDEDHKPISDFVKEVDKYPKLKKLIFAIEGLIKSLGAHAAGILILKDSPSKHNSIMRTNTGTIVSAFNLEDSEQMGGLKYDMLTVAALDKIHATLNYMLEDRVIEWEKDLRTTYNKYLLPANLEYNDPRMWQKLWEGEVIDVFQFDTMVGSQAIKLIKPQSITELAIANSIMRLMAQDGMELPLDTFVKYKKDINQWYHEMRLYGLGPEEIRILEPHLKVLYGVADSQEAAMQLVMDEKITGFTLNEANSLRKAIAKKKADVLIKTKELYYEKGRGLKTNPYLLDYVWNIQIGRQIGYSFSILHTIAYSAIAIQQMNLVFKYPSIYWKTACLSVNAGAVNEEDYYNLVSEGVIELSDEEDIRANTKIQYGKVASAIGDMRGTIEIKQPDINKSRMGFTPNAEENTILYGIKGISRVGDAIVQNIILNRPYTGVMDFVSKMITVDNKKLISKDKVINLIKAGAFDRVENRPRKEILKDYIMFISDAKKRLTLANFPMMMKNNLVPERFEEEMKCYNFTKYIRKSRYKKYYVLDDIAKEYFLERFPADKITKLTVDGKKIDAIPESWWDAIYMQFMLSVKKWFKDNEKELLEKLNDSLFQTEYKKYASGDILDWELDSLNFFYSGHPLDGIEVPIKITKYDDIIEGEIVGHFNIRGKTIPKMKLSTIMGTVIDKNKNRGIVTLATKDAVVNVKFYKQQYALYSHKSDLEEDEEDYKANQEDFFEKGSHLAITGIKRGDMFLPKVYKNSGIHEVLKLVIEDGKFKEFKAKSSM